MPIELSERQREILRRVVDAYIETGKPVGSKYLVESGHLAVSSATVRAELAELERQGLLTHPHTSAGRVPTDDGYRLYVEALLDRLEPRPQGFPLDLIAAQSEVEDALQATTDTLSRVTRLLALVSAPPLEASTVRHVEVLLLQPHVVMVVVITSTGGVGKRVFTFEDAVDPGIANWANQYLNEQLAGIQLGTHQLRQRLGDPSLGGRERAFLGMLRGAFVGLERTEEQRLFVGGAAGLLDEVRGGELAAYRNLLETLEQRAALLRIMAGAIGSRRPFVRVGDEVDAPQLHDLSLVGASYGLAHRTLGAVSLVGPVRMDYEKAIRSVRAAAHELSRFVEEIYEND